MATAEERSRVEGMIEDFYNRSTPIERLGLSHQMFMSIDGSKDVKQVYACCGAYLSALSMVVTAQQEQIDKLTKLVLLKKG